MTDFVPLNLKRVLNKSDKQRLRNLYQALQKSNKVFVNASSYDAFCRMFPDVVNYTKNSLDNGYIITKE